MQTVWPDIAAALHPNDRPAPKAWQSCYETKFAIARLLQPKRIFEIGVRTSYSAFAFLRAVPHAHYFGIDAKSNTHGGFSGAIDHARRLLTPYDAQVHEQTSAEFAESLNGTSPNHAPWKCNFDLIHVDGDHSQTGCDFDLGLALRLGFRHLLVDDYTGIPDVRLACDRFSESHQNQLTSIVINDGHNGCILFTNNEPD